MRAKSSFLKRIGAVALAAGVVFGTLATGAQITSAASGFQVADKKYEKTYKLDDGTVYFEAKGVFPVISDDSAAAKKINQVLTKEKNKWIRTTRTEAEEAKSFLADISRDDTMEMPEWSSSDEIAYEITSNNGKYFSVLMSSYVFTGGAHGLPYRIALTFDAKTGEKLTAAKLFGTTKNKVNKKARNLYLKLYDKKGIEAGFYGDDIFSGKKARDVLKDALASMDFNNKFYVKNGKAVFYADPYELGPYAAGFIETSATVK